MAAIRDLSKVAAKWAEVTPQRSQQYADGVREPKADWARGAAGANAAWKAGVQAAVGADRFLKGVNAAGTARWQDGAVSKGTTRFGQGVALAQDRFREGFAPYHQAISSLTLPARFARRDPRNLERVKAVVEALKAVKERVG